VSKEFRGGPSALKTQPAMDHLHKAGFA
jgi:hypothetical protein